MKRFIEKWLPLKIQRKRVLVESLLFLAAYVLWLIFRQTQSPSRWYIGSLGVLSPALAACVLIFRLLPQFPAPSRRAWQFLGLGLAWWTLGMTVKTFANLIWSNQETVLLALEAVNLPVYALLFCSLFFQPFEYRYSPSRFRFLLDAFISSGVVATICWLSIARTANHLSGYQVILLLYPIGDLVLLMVLINRLLASQQARITLLLWGAGLVAFLFSDYTYSLLTPIGGYFPGSPETLGWTLGGLIFCIGTAIGASLLETKANNRTNPIFGLGARIQNILPISLVLVLVWFVLDNWWLSGHMSIPGLWVSGFLTLALIARIGAQVAEAELHRYRQLFDSLAEPAFICDQTGKIVLGNPALIAATGKLDDNLIIGKHIGDLFTGIDQPSEILKDTSRQAHSMEVTLLPAGTPYLLSLSPIVAEGRKTYLAGAAYDLSSQKRQQEIVQEAFTDLKRLHKELEEMNAVLEQKVQERTHTLEEAYLRLEEQNKMLQALDKMKSDFVSMVSHELRTPLTSLNGGLELMLTRNSRRNGDRVPLELMQSEVRRLTNFVENILNLSAVEAGQINIHQEPVSLKEAMAEVKGQFNHSPGSDMIRIEAAEGLPDAWADVVLLESILKHLIDNALKYAPGCPIVMQAYPENDLIRIQVTDSGPGIPEEKKTLLFKRFQRLDAKDSQSVYGYGLGLYFSRQLLQALDSDLQYEPSPNGGARFFFYLRAAR